MYVYVHVYVSLCVYVDVDVDVSLPVETHVNPKGSLPPPLPQGGGLGSARQSGRSPPSSSGSQQDEAIRDMFLQDIKNSGHPISAEFLAQFESAGAGGGSSSRSSSGREHSQHQEGGGGGSTRRRVGSAPPASRGSRALSVATERQPVEDCGVPNNTEVHLPGKSQVGCFFFFLHCVRFSLNVLM